MSKNHIISFIENAPLARLSKSDLVAIRAHTADCLDCRRAFETAHISMLLLKERAAETFEPSPFLHTRVLATLRERQTGAQWGWTKVWRAAGALASSMVVTVVALAALTFISPGSQSVSPPQDMTLALNAYSAEEVLLDQGETFNDQVSEDQILRTLYGAEDEAAR